MFCQIWRREMIPMNQVMDFYQMPQASSFSGLVNIAEVLAVALIVIVLIICALKAIQVLHAPSGKHWKKPSLRTAGGSSLYGTSVFEGQNVKKRSEEENE